MRISAGKDPDGPVAARKTRSAVRKYSECLPFRKRLSDVAVMPASAAISRFNRGLVSTAIRNATVNASGSIVRGDNIGKPLEQLAAARTSWRPRAAYKNMPLERLLNSCVNGQSVNEENDVPHQIVAICTVPRTRTKKPRRLTKPGSSVDRLTITVVV